MCWHNRPTIISRLNTVRRCRVVQALQAVSPDLAKVEPELIRVLERASGLKELRFESEPFGGNRQVQSMLDRNGRIVGWFSWEPERPALLPRHRARMAALHTFSADKTWP